MSKAKVVLSEKYLLTALDRVAKNALGYAVLYINISKLKPKNRHPEFVKIIAMLFESIIGAAKGSMYILSNGDIAILSKNITPSEIDEAVKKLRAGLAADPVLSHDSRDFALVYSFPRDFFSFYGKIEKMVQENKEAETEELPVKEPVEAEDMDKIISTLDDIDMAELVKRQSVMRVHNNEFTDLMQEFFVAVKDLSRYFGDNKDLVANRWLFQYLTQVLDKKTLAAFASAEITEWPEKISLNLNLSSVFSKEFVEFAKNFLKPAQQIIVEVQMMDILNNLNLYHEVKDILHKGGHKLLIDSLSPASLSMLNLDKLAPDMIKIFWEPLLVYDTDNQSLKNAVEYMKPENVILAKCDGSEAMRWGLSYGLNTFQGPYIDEIEIALIRRQCPNAKICGSLDCIKRRRLLQGMFRDECPHKDILEKIL
ncbi:MAG: hypothetical protein Q4F75_01295 [Pseudomonadota bacterium]|nr:hypothetical protein [Pseudomonadota bacterium]